MSEKIVGIEDFFGEFEPNNAIPEPVGRPTKYRPIFAKMVVGMHGGGCQGFTFTRSELSEMFQVNQSTIERWLNAHQEFRSAVEEGVMKLDDMVESAIHQRALGFSNAGQFYPPDVSAAKFWLTNRRKEKWADSNNNHNVNVNLTVSEELSNARARARATLDVDRPGSMTIEADDQ